MFIKVATYVDLKTTLATLEAQVASLRAQVAAMGLTLSALEAVAAKERARADSAVDQMLITAGTRPITPTQHNIQEFDGLFEEDPKTVRNLHTAIKEKGAEAVLFAEDTEAE